MLTIPAPCLSFTGLLQVNKLINLMPCDFTFDQECSKLKFSIARMTSCDRVTKSWWVKIILVLVQ